MNILLTRDITFPDGTHQTLRIHLCHRTNSLGGECRIHSSPEFGGYSLYSYVDGKFTALTGIYPEGFKLEID